jgi:hypothetical protein
MKTTPTASKPWTEKKRKAMVKKIERLLRDLDKTLALLKEVEANLSKVAS